MSASLELDIRQTEPFKDELTSISSFGTSFKVRFIQVSNAIGPHYLNLEVTYFSVHSTFQLSLCMSFGLHVLSHLYSFYSFYFECI
jgi:hypothetical protein